MAADGQGGSPRDDLIFHSASSDGWLVRGRIPKVQQQAKPTMVLALVVFTAGRSWQIKRKHKEVWHKNTGGLGGKGAHDIQWNEEQTWLPGPSSQWTSRWPMGLDVLCLCSYGELSTIYTPMKAQAKTKCCLTKCFQVPSLTLLALSGALPSPYLTILLDRQRFETRVVSSSPVRLEETVDPLECICYPPLPPSGPGKCISMSSSEFNSFRFHIQVRWWHIYRS